MYAVCQASFSDSVWAQKLQSNRIITVKRCNKPGIGLSSKHQWALQYEYWVNWEWQLWISHADKRRPRLFQPNPSTHERGHLIGPNSRTRVHHRTQCSLTFTHPTFLPPFRLISPSRKFPASPPDVIICTSTNIPPDFSLDLVIWSRLHLFHFLYNLNLFHSFE